MSGIPSSPAQLATLLAHSNPHDANLNNLIGQTTHNAAMFDPHNARVIVEHLWRYERPHDVDTFMERYHTFVDLHNIDPLVYTSLIRHWTRASWDLRDFWNATMRHLDALLWCELRQGLGPDHEAATTIRMQVGRALVVVIEDFYQLVEVARYHHHPPTVAHTQGLYTGKEPYAYFDQIAVVENLTFDATTVRATLPRLEASFDGVLAGARAIYQQDMVEEAEREWLPKLARLRAHRAEVDAFPDQLLARRAAVEETVRRAMAEREGQQGPSGSGGLGPFGSGGQGPSGSGSGGQGPSGSGS